MKVSIGPYGDAGRDSERGIDIHVDDWDTWSLDHTLALIIAPCLQQLKATTHGAPHVENEDVPEALHMPEGHDWMIQTDDDWFARWDHVLDEMIFAFGEIAYNEELYKATEDTWIRVQNGCRLFGKYYCALWD